MPPKGGNAKKEGGRAKKAENEAKKKDAAAASKETKEVEEWSKGAKESKTDKEDRRKAELERKAENARMLAEEEASAPAKVKAAPKAGNKSKPAPPKPAGPGAIAAGGGLGGSGPRDKHQPEGEIESYSATGIDNALDLLEVVTAKMDKASVGSQAAGLEKHPERRFKAAYEAYEQRELPNARADHPGLRLQQYKELLFKQFQKAPENPFNQTTVSYDATKEERVDALTSKRTETENRLREKGK